METFESALDSATDFSIRIEINQLWFEDIESSIQTIAYAIVDPSTAIDNSSSQALSAHQDTDDHHPQSGGVSEKGGFILWMDLFTLGLQGFCGLQMGHKKAKWNQ